MKKLLNIYGCSFTENFRYLELEYLFSDYDLTNHAKQSSNNFYIFDKFKSHALPESINVIQWSSLTRPFDENYSLLKTSDNPLYDFLEQWYELLEETQIISKERNLKLIQYIGWAEWKDSELNDYHRDKLKSYGITWFKSSKTLDCISSNCFQFQIPTEWSSREVLNGLHQWGDLEWGGMSEWIRENVEMGDRYLGWNNGTSPTFDSHPSTFATKKFIEEVILPKINAFI